MTFSKLFSIFLALIFGSFQISAQSDIQTDTTLIFDEDIVIVANRNSSQPLIAVQQITSEELRLINTGVDIPVILDQTPSLSWYSDAGNGVGYTGLRIRGSDPTRVNVTINGVPYNDSESQGVFWVDLPDLLSSARSIDVQRGLGYSTNGAGAFGGSVNINLSQPKQDAYISYSGGAGSYSTFKNTLAFGTGNLSKFKLDGRLSLITSDGYIDRASSNLRSYYANGAVDLGKGILNIISFGGTEETYQAWNGVPEDLLESDRTFNSAGTDFGSKEGEPYENEVDHYSQYHNYLGYHSQLNELWRLSATAHYTRGLGYFENYKVGETLSDYGYTNNSDEADVIRRRWLDNHFYGAILNTIFEKDQLRLTLGTGVNKYDGDHFGEAAEVVGQPELGSSEYYRSNGSKTDAQAFAKVEMSFSKLLVTVDVQGRLIDYNLLGTENDGFDIDQELDYQFFNPKIGLNYSLSNSTQIFGFAGIGHKEPTREDILSRYNVELPQSERLLDLEIGATYKQDGISLGATLFHMDYDNQLVATGQINDVGALQRQNVKDSYRQGIELEGGFKDRKWDIGGNVSFLKSNISNFSEIVTTYDPSYTPIPDETVVIDHEDTNIALTPDIIAQFSIGYNISDVVILNGSFNTVGRQFLDNTERISRSLDPYTYVNASVTFRPKIKGITSELQFSLFNVFDELYESNGYTFSERYQYIDDQNMPQFTDVQTYNYYYPQAGRNVMVNWSIGF